MIVLLLETTDDVPNSTYIFLPNKIYVIDILANGNTLLIQIQSVVFVYKNTLTISSCLMAHCPPYQSRPSKVIILHMTKICNGDMLLILLPKVSTQTMTNPLKGLILSRQLHVQSQQ